MKSRLKFGVKYTIEKMDICIPFLEQVVLSDYEKKEILGISSQDRRYQYLSVRYLLQEIVMKRRKKYNGLMKNSQGKPFLIGLQDQNISISHSGPYVATALSQKAIGIDMQIINQNINNVAHKFLSNKELKYENLTSRKLTTFWCIKESIYKCANHSSQKKFKDNIQISDFNIKRRNCVISKIGETRYVSFCFQFKDSSLAISIRKRVRNFKNM